ncbi:MAG TPA: S16 family serine protease [Longimicrobiales bacterium]|nr:S16 family serine protease [Longimicrobiales bacterium]
MAKNAPAGLPDSLPIMPLRSTAVFPLGVAAVQVGDAAVLEMLAANPEPGLLVAAVIAPGGPDDPVDPESLKKVAIMARVSDRLNLPGGSVQATLQGIQRIRIRSVSRSDGHLVAGIAATRDRPIRDEDASALIARILNALEGLSGHVERISAEVPRILRMNLGDAGRFVDLVAVLSNFSVASKDHVIQALSIRGRLGFAVSELEGQLAHVRRMSGDNAAADSAAAADAPGRGAELRRRIKLLQAELGDVDPVEAEVVSLLRRVDSAAMPAAAASKARAEIERLRHAGHDSGAIRTYVDWLLSMPWRRTASEGPARIDLAKVATGLDEELLGLDEAKNRILDHLAVARLRKSLGGPVPCIVGPPDTGKAALVAALARCLGRPLVRLDVRGRSAGDLLGVRRTRADAQPGRLAALLRDAKVADPVILLGDLQELGSAKGEDTAEALEEILTSEPRRLMDRYLEVPFELGDALFVAIAQDLQKVPRGVREQLIEIRIAGYTPEEKVDIAKSRLLPKMTREHGLKPGHVAFPEPGLYHIAYGYARDAGIGTFQRAVETLLRTRARARAEGDASKWTFDAERIENVLGVPRFVATTAESAPEVGVVTGLAWTASGGELMFIEALRMPGSGRLIITGMLGDAMRESVNAAYSYVRSRGPTLGITEDDFRDSDVHVHFPVGAIPKDGPSAGVAVTLAIASSLSNRAVRHDMAMSGEVTLRGRVLEVGGIKEKVLAAHRADIRRVILPSGNEKDLRDVPERVRAGIAFHLVDRMDDVMKLALLGGTTAAVRLRSDAAREPRVARRGKT